MNKISRLTALLLALMMIFSTFAAAETAYSVGGMTMEQWEQLVEQAEDNLYTIDEGDAGKTITPESPEQAEHGDYYPYSDGVTAELADEAVSCQISPSGVAILTNPSAGQWQMKVGDVWADLSGETGSTLAVTGAMMNGMTTAEVRKALEPKDENGAYTAFTQAASVTVVNTLPVRLMATSRADVYGGEVEDENAAEVYSLQRANENLQKHLITIEYRFRNNHEVAATPYYAEVSTTTATFSATVKHPTIVGYQPIVISQDDMPDGFSCDAAQITIDNASVEGDVNIIVYYEPAEVKFTVNFWREKAVYTIDPATGEEVKYDKVGTSEYEGYTEATVASAYPVDAAEQYFATLYAAAGFKALLYDENIKIAADGSTVVDVYYQRLYYLMVFNLGGGAGVNPVYAKHGAMVGTVGTPTRPGYEHMGWTLDKDATVYTADYDQSKFETIPETVQIGNVTYYAVWKAVDVPFRVTYWLEDPNWDGVNEGNRYLYWGSVEKTALTGTTVYATDYESYSEIAGELDTYEKRYSAYNAEMTDREDDDGIQVAGDGSTVLNVFYDRNEYTLRFYYAMSSGTGENTQYYVIGGSTYRFGASATIADNKKDDAIALLDHYMYDYAGQRGRVKEMPTLNAQGSSRPYSSGSDKSTVNGTEYTYYYIEFTANYGADISELWPCDVFGSVEANDKTSSSAWAGKEAFVSAWNGEHHVYYSLHNSNQTIKGNYYELDYQLLWDQCDQHSYGDSNTVDYLCFWENGAAVNWNIPELYRYNIYVALLPGQSEEGLTIKSYNGVKYREVVVFNTVDDSTADAQTPPAINGLQYVGYTYVNLATGNDDPILYENGVKVYSEAYDMFFYYARKPYELTFSNYDAGIEVKGHVFEEDISSYNTYIPQNPPSYPAGTYVFDGWYTSPEHQAEAKYTFDTMPANDVILYAKWRPIKHTVTVYNTREDAVAAIGGASVQHLYQWVDKVSHGSATSSAYDYSNKDQYDPETQEFPQPTRPGYEFALWYYYAPDGTEQPFSFNATPITEDTIVYAGWTADSLADYTIYYVKSGTAADKVDVEANWVAAPTYGSGLAGATTTERAKGGTELYAGYQTGFFPTLESHSFTLNVDASKNVYVFEYVPVEKVPYKVKYLEAGTDKVIAPEKIVTENNKAVVTENYVQISGNYVPDAFQKRLVIKAGSTIDENVIVFYYTKDESHTTVEVEHYLLHAGSNVPELFDAVKEIVQLPYSHTVVPKTVSHYAYDSSMTTRKVGGNATQLDSSLEINLPENSEGVVLKLYYVEETVEINYVAVGPVGAVDFGTVTPEKETVGKVTGVAGATAAAGSEYKFIGWYSDAACTVRVGTDAAFVPERENGVHVAATYYALFEEKQATITYVAVGNGTVDPESETLNVVTGVAKGSTATAATNHHFVGWYTDADCKVPVDSSWVTEGKITPVKADGTAWPESTTYYAKFEEDEVTITYVAALRADGTVTVRDATGGLVDLNDGVSSAAVEAEETVKVSTETAKGATAAPNANYKFVGWYDNAACSGEARSTDASYVPGKTNGLNTEATYYALFELDVADLVIEKTVNGEENPPIDPFELTISLPDGVYNYTSKQGAVTVEGVLTVSGGTGAMVIRDGEKITIHDIAIGSAYAVAEADLPWFDEVIEASGTQIAAENNRVTITNTYRTGTLTVKKVVVVQAGVAAPSADTEFTFEVELKNAPLGGSVAVSIDNAEPQSMPLINGKLTFKLKDGQMAKIEDLPRGTDYVVTEVNVPDNFVVSYDGMEAGKIDGDVITTVTNNYPERYADLTVTKSGLQKSKESAVIDVVVTTNGASQTYTLVLNQANPSATITGIPVGSNYTVTERDAWTWQYKDTTAQRGTIVDGGSTVTVANIAEGDKWLHDESYLVNNINTGTKSGVND